MNENDLKANGCIDRINSEYNSLSEAARKVADVILADAGKVIHLTIGQMAEQTGASEASIVRFCQNLRYSGYNDLKIHLAAEMSNDATIILEDLQPGDTEADILKKVFQAESQALHDTVSSLDPRTFEYAVNRILFANHIEFFSYGNSRPLALDMHYRLMRIGMDSRVGVDIADSALHASMLGPKDVAIGISHSGSTKHTISMLENARKSGATTICVTGMDKTPITHVSDICLISRTNETMFRDVAMTSRIAQLAILDALYVAVAFKRLEFSRKSMESNDRYLSEEKY